MRWVRIMLLCTSAVICHADVNVLIVEPRTGFDGKEIQVHLQKILQGAGMGAVHVGLTGPSEADQKNLSGWLYDPDHDAKERRSNLRGEGGTAWHYVVIMENPEVIETFPGWYAQGVHDVTKEIERGTGEAVLLMQWPSADSAATLDYYRDVAYRVGRGRGVKVVPAGLARKAFRSTDVTSSRTSSELTTDGNLSRKDAAYIAAASIYSRLWNKSAAGSSYSYNDDMAKAAFTTVVENRGVRQYSGPFTSAPNGIHTIAGNQNRIIRIINDGWRSRGYPLETVDNRHTWGLTQRMGLINRRTAKEKAGASSGLARKGTPKDHADLHYIASTAIRDTTAGLYISHLSNYVYNRDAMDYAARVKKAYNDDAPALAKRWNAGDKRLRQLPPYLLISQIFSHFQTYDKDELDIHLVSKHCYASYMITMLTGRCPMVLDSVGTKGYAIEQIGYETAWRFSTLHGRAPGFKTWPTTPLRMTVDPTHAASLQVAFALPPQSNVTVTASSTHPFVSMSPRELIFSPSNYITPQTVSVSVAESAIAGTRFDVVFSTTSRDIVYDELSNSWSYVVNTPPTADNLKATVLSDQLNAIQLFGSDADEMSNDFGSEPPPPITEPLSYHIEQQSTNGTVSIGGSVAAYTPAPGFTGVDSFTYRSKDFSVYSDEATVNITVEKAPLFGRNLLVNGSAELVPFIEFGWVQQDAAWSQTSATNDGFYAFRTANKNEILGTLYQDVDVSDLVAYINKGTLQFKISGYGASVNDEAKVILTYMNSDGRVLMTADTGRLPKLMTYFENTALAPVGTATIRVLLHAAKGKGTNGCRFDGLRLDALDPTKPIDD